MYKLSEIQFCCASLLVSRTRIGRREHHLNNDVVVHLSEKGNCRSAEGFQLPGRGPRVPQHYYTPRIRMETANLTPRDAGQQP